MDNVKYKKIQQVQLTVILLNIITSVSKLFIGVLTNSVAITADGFHSMGDGLNNVIGMAGIYFAFQPVDDKHPYGHRKFETLTTFFISGILLMTSLSLLKGAYNRIINPATPMVTPASFIIMILSIVINLFVTIYERKMGRALKSEFLLSDATHTLSDVFVSISVIGTLIAVKFGYYWIDTVVSIVISLLIVKVAIDIIIKGTNVLLDAVVIDPKEITEAIIEEFQEVHSCHKIRSRGYPDDIYIDLHVVASYDMTLAKVHNLIHSIDEYLKLKFPGVKDVHVHVDPLDYF